MLGRFWTGESPAFSHSFLTAESRLQFDIRFQSGDRLSDLTPSTRCRSCFAVSLARLISRAWPPNLPGVLAHQRGDSYIQVTLVPMPLFVFSAPVQCHLPFNGSCTRDANYFVPTLVVLIVLYEDHIAGSPMTSGEPFCAIQIRSFSTFSNFVSVSPWFPHSVSVLVICGRTSDWIRPHS